MHHFFPLRLHRHELYLESKAQVDDPGVRELVERVGYEVGDFFVVKEPSADRRLELQEEYHNPTFEVIAPLIHEPIPATEPELKSEKVE